MIPLIFSHSSFPPSSVGSNISSACVVSFSFVTTSFCACVRACVRSLSERAQFCMTSVARASPCLEDAQGRTRQTGRTHGTGRSRPWNNSAREEVPHTPLTLFRACKVIKIYSLSWAFKNKFCLVPPLIFFFFFSITLTLLPTVVATARAATSLLRQRSCARPLTHSHEHFLPLRASSSPTNECGKTTERLLTCVTL